MRAFCLLLSCALTLVAAEAVAQCSPLPPLPRGTCAAVDPTGENDCDGDGCKARDGDCNDCDATIRASTCPGGTVGTRVTPAGAAPEICDGKDNNCGGGVDEGPGGAAGTVDAGMACFVSGQQGVCRNGSTICQGTMGVICNQTVMSSQESCDGRDNDCDGDTDEVGASGTPKLTQDCFPTPQSMFGSPDAGVCRVGQQACVAAANSGTATWTACGMCGAVTPTTTCQAPVTSQPLTPGGPESVCNGIDDDCDGQVDDGIAGVGASCSVMGQQGLCATGRVQCNGGGGLGCQQTVFSTTEICDGLDNDCDGFVDEEGATNLPKLKRACTGNNTGPCRSGEQACNATAGSGMQSWTGCGSAACGSLASCTNVVSPQPEMCDLVDNDCDGNLNNGNPGGGAACTNNAVSGVCRDGTQVCQSSGMLQCISTIAPGSQTEVCDGLDNDCDGATDEVAGVGSATISRVCYAGPGGTFTGTCGGNPNNCAPRGICRGVTQVCPGVGGFPACTTSTIGADGGSQRFNTGEICNGQDDDCNGTNDNNVDGGGISCSPDSGVGYCAMAGTTACVSAAMVCQPRTGIAETCNGVDDDCDGDTDETGSPGSMRLSRVCYAGPAGTFTGMCTTMPPGTNCTPTGACRGVNIFCTAGAFPACSASTVGIDGGTQFYGSTEICDNLDNNCNGQTNEGLSGGACTTSLPGVCRDGIEQCRTNGTIDCVQLVDAGPELCDTLDNDCNGVPDDNVPPRACFDGPSGSFTGTCGLSDGGVRTSGGGACSTRGLCRASTQLCNGAGNWLTCGSGGGQQQQLPRPEICNGLDEDCDNNADNGLIIDFDNDGVRACGTCGANPDGGCDCQDDAGTVRPGLLETCNGLDDNCNGRLDEASTGTGKITRSCYTGPANTAGVGECVQGVEECNAMPNGAPSFGMCMGQVVPTAETCNMRDDDCNGTVDDGFDVDRDGFRACVACGLTMNCDCNDNDATIRPGATELCDNVDNNCNGMIDDLLPRACFSDSAGMNPAPTTYTGTCPGPTCTPKGVCRVGAQTCTAGVWGTCANPTLPRAEQCDNTDDDCDGVVDNGNFDLDMDRYVSCALCGNRIAPDGGIGCDCNDSNAMVNPAAPEICDGIDNNCDMVTDGTDTACYSGPPITRGKGVCRDGLQTCVQGMGQGVCRNERLPGLLADGGSPVFEPDAGVNDPEATCDGIDDDCDGIVDDGFDEDGDGVTRCQNDCDDRDPFNKPGGAEICDCKDNNCNMLLDDGDICRGAPCHDFDRDGFTNCQGDCNDDPAAGGFLAGPTRTERVGDGLDNDCDGQVDENVDEDGDGYATGGPASMRDCNDKLRDVHPGAVEICDGFDNNCDIFGIDGGFNVDEGFDMDGDRVAVCAGDCRDDDATVNPTRREVCGNAKDDNCDGRIDEDTDVDGDGVSTCQGDCNDFNAAVHPAAGSVMAAAEVCDGQDNNCDGQFDEGHDQDSDGTAACFGDCDDMVATVGPHAYEIPNNNVDDDCDGEIDEGQMDRDGDGFPPVCGDCNDFDPRIHPRSAEVCNRVDDNCDAYIDSLPGRPNLCSVCFDADGDGQTNCDGDCNDNDISIYRGALEVCDLKDNDCDMQVDLDPVTGRRVCSTDGGTLIDAGVVDAGSDADAGQPDGGGTVIGGDDAGVEEPHVRDVVTTGCGCGATGSGVWALAFAAWALVRRRRSRGASSSALRSSVAGVVVAGVLASCASTVSVPRTSNDAGMNPDVDGGSNVDGGETDAGVDAGLVLPANWPCPGLSPVVQAARLVPGTVTPFAFPAHLAVSERLVANALLFEGPDLAGFVLQRPVPTGVNILDPAAVELVGNAEINSLPALSGTPLVRDRLERSSRIIENKERPAQELRTLTSSQQLTFGAPTTAFAVRNRLLSSLSTIDPGMLGMLPEGGAGATLDSEQVVNLFFRVVGTRVFIGVVVTPAAKLRQNLIVLSDLSNGSHLGDENAELTEACLKQVTPALKTDFLFVIDNTISMVEEQRALQDAASGLFEAFQRAGLDFRLGVITTDSDILRGGGFVTDLNGFKSAAAVGLSGNTTEMGIEYSMSAITRARAATAPNLVLRDKATTGLVVIYLSDEDNKTTRTFQDYVTSFRAEQAVAFSIVGPKPVGCIRVGRGEATVGQQYIDLANATGGSSGSICNPNLSEVIEEVVIGALGASSRSPLEKRPISGSLSVRSATERVLSRDRTDGFDYEPARNSILFFGPSAPTVGSQYEAAFQYFNYIN